MVDREFAEALDDTREINITTVGRKTGTEITLPVWFVRQDDTLYLLPVGPSRRPEGGARVGGDTDHRCCSGRGGGQRFSRQVRRQGRRCLLPTS